MVIITKDLTEMYKKALEAVVVYSDGRGIKFKAVAKSRKFKRDLALEEMSYIIIKKKINYIKQRYWREIIKTEGIRKKYFLHTKCIDFVEINHPRLTVVFNAAKVFPVFYVDLIVISDISKLLDVNEIEVEVKNLWARYISPYVLQAAKYLAITNMNPKFLELAKKYEKLYLDVIYNHLHPGRTEIIKCATFYGAHVLKLYSRRDARKLYYKVRYKGELHGTKL